MAATEQTVTYIEDKGMVVQDSYYKWKPTLGELWRIFKYGIIVSVQHPYGKKYRVVQYYPDRENIKLVEIK